MPLQRMPRRQSNPKLNRSIVLPLWIRSTNIAIQHVNPSFESMDPVPVECLLRSTTKHDQTRAPLPAANSRRLQSRLFEPLRQQTLDSVHQASRIRKAAIEHKASIRIRLQINQKIVQKTVQRQPADTTLQCCVREDVDEHLVRKDLLGRYLFSHAFEAG
jgi:hypothetical protein